MSTGVRSAACFLRQLHTSALVSGILRRSPAASSDTSSELRHYLVCKPSAGPATDRVRQKTRSGSYFTPPHAKTFSSTIHQNGASEHTVSNKQILLNPRSHPSPRNRLVPHRDLAETRGLFCSKWDLSHWILLYWQSPQYRLGRGAGRILSYWHTSDICPPAHFLLIWMLGSQM